MTNQLSLPGRRLLALKLLSFPLRTCVRVFVIIEFVFERCFSSYLGDILVT